MDSKKCSFRTFLDLIKYKSNLKKFLKKKIRNNLQNSENNLQDDELNMTGVSILDISQLNEINKMINPNHVDEEILLKILNFIKKSNEVILKLSDQNNKLKEYIMSINI